MKEAITIEDMIRILQMLYDTSERDSDWKLRNELSREISRLQERH